MTAKKRAHQRRCYHTVDFKFAGLARPPLLRLEHMTGYNNMDEL